MMANPSPPPSPSEADALRRRRARSLAIALSIGALIAIFYVITIFKLGPAVLNRSL
jgi:hypothetical protein